METNERRHNPKPRPNPRKFRRKWQKEIDITITSGRLQHQWTKKPERLLSTLISIAERVLWLRPVISPKTLLVPPCGAGVVLHGGSPINKAAACTAAPHAPTNPRKFRKIRLEVF